MGLKNAVVCDREGAIYRGRPGLSGEKLNIAEITNFERKKGTIASVMRGADVFIGVSARGTVSSEMARSMAANPVPEIMPDAAFDAEAAVVGTGRSDFPNQINNVLAFPGVFRGALDVRARDINDEMKIAARVLSGLVSETELRADYIIPVVFDPRVRAVVSGAVADAARKTGTARL
jgi:malate dehydrogenase (oxaloacetate-decarboxylating)